MSQFAAGTLQAGTLIINHTSPPKLPTAIVSYYTSFSDLVIGRFSKKWISSARCSNGYCRAARRRVRDEEEDDDDDGFGYNEDIEKLELYSQSARGEALLVNAVVDDQEAQVLIFKGFSSSLSHGTASDPSKSVLPARAVIESVDRIKGPFDPSNVEYIERGLTWEDFRSRLRR